MQDAAILGLGYLGRPLAQKLYLSGCQVAAVKRSLSSDDVNLPVSLKCADFNDIVQHRSIFDQTWADKPVWMCLLPPTPFAAYDACLKNWCNLANEYGIKHLVFSSSISVYGSRERECNEESLLEPETESACKIVEAETVFLQSGIEHVDILRLGGLYSASRHPLNRILQQGKAIPNGNQRVNMVHQDAAVSALFNAVMNPNGIRIRNIVAQDHPTKREFYTAQAQSLGLPVPEFETGNGGGKIVRTLFDDI
ncbi:GDP-L-fucose synthase [Neisseria wadsworthii]|uniref:GDP-L-fucose synthase n=1 Tax=Neisseria wadsworthii 9715 TaxID=1030841 RepID=G4CQQ6_9NEIS|nr:GDP-L-fucose synthase [Neisseria wadsworthii]EGZ46158.1 GDP-L-fucose synthase [Neisseria wadsworthii 9715]QMT35150.1 SDR family NAD(P)-dependent oxidoreductase [Neisseria wadsworthii]